MHSSFRIALWIVHSGFALAWPSREDETSFTIFQMSSAVIAYALTWSALRRVDVSVPGGVMQSSSIFRG